MRKGRVNKADRPTKDTGLLWATALAMGTIDLAGLRETNRNKYRHILRSFALEVSRHGMRLNICREYYVLEEPKPDGTVSGIFAEARTRSLEKTAQEFLQRIHPDAVGE